MKNGAAVAGLAIRRYGERSKIGPELSVTENF